MGLSEFPPPHGKEFSRLSGYSVEEIIHNGQALAESFAKECQINVLLKNAYTLVTNGEKTLWNGSGNSGQAKGGSGDVLAGAIASFASQGISPYDSAVCGVYLHSKAGRLLSGEYSEYGVRPSDLPKRMAKALSKIIKK